MMDHHVDDPGASAPENYERFFVPAIGRPLAEELVASADIAGGDRVLDVACGTGVVARLAFEKTGSGGLVAGVDINPGMLAVARKATPAGRSIEWHEANAESMPLPDESFDVAFCQLSLQFMPDKPAALREMRRVLAGNGRLRLNVPGPASPVFEALAEGMERHIGPEAAGFVGQVFSLHDTAEIEQLLAGAGFREVEVQAERKVLSLPAPREFLWQYIDSTPLVQVVGEAGDEARSALEREVVARWKDFEEGGALRYEQRIVTAGARK